MHTVDDTIELPAPTPLHRIIGGAVGGLVAAAVVAFVVGFLVIKRIRVVKGNILVKHVQ